jgi:hypothetical protein
MRGFQHLDAPGWRDLTVAGDDDPAEIDVALASITVAVF